MEGAQPNTPSSPPTTGEDKTVAIVAYITLVGFIVAIVLHGQKKTALGSYHLKQALGLILTWVACWIAGMVLAVVTLGIGALIMPIIALVFLVALIMGIVAAANGEMKPSFLLGKQYEQWFKNAFN